MHCQESERRGGIFLKGIPLENQRGEGANVGGNFLNGIPLEIQSGLGVNLGGNFSQRNPFRNSKRVLGKCEVLLLGKLNNQKTAVKIG